MNRNMTRTGAQRPMSTPITIPSPNAMVSSSFAPPRAKSIAEFIHVRARSRSPHSPLWWEAREALTQIVGEGHRASQVIGSIRALFKKDSQEKAQLDVNQIIREVLALVGGELRSQNILVQIELSEPLPCVSGVRIQLQQVILNLLTNAIEAIGSTSGRARVLRVSSARHEPYGVLITVADTGPGIDPKNMDRIFDSFFTTKSHGMGMGLSICRSIIEAHEGHLSLSPGAGGGTAFQIALPTGEAAS